MRFFTRSLLFISSFNAAVAVAQSFPANSTTAATTSPPSSTITAAPSFTNTCDASHLQGYYLYSGYSTDPALQCYCLTQLDNWLSTTDPPTRTLTRSIGTGALTTTFVSGGTTYTETTELVTVGTYTVTLNLAAADGNFWPGSATSPCCSSCTVAAATVNLFYWPTPAIPSAATSFVSNNFTYVSPSVYIGFTSLYAYDFCGQVGNSYISTTVAFDPGELSSVGSPIPTLTQTDLYTSINTLGQLTTSTNLVLFNTGGPPEPINYADLGQNCSAIAGYTYVPGNPSQTDFITYDPCHPTIILPTRVQSLDPAWVTCVNNGIGGFYDPPYALTAAEALLPPTSTLPPSPASTPQPILSPTSAMSDNAPPSSGPPNPPQASPTASSTQPSIPTTGAESSYDPGLSNTAGTGPSPSNPSSGGPSSENLGGGGGGPGSQGSPSNGPSNQTPPPIVIGSSTVTPNSASQYVIGSQTLSAGGPAVVAGGSTYSIAPSGVVVVNGITQQPPTITTGEALIVGGSTATANSASEFVVGSQIISPGGPAVTIGGSIYSLPATGSVIVINGATTPLATYTRTNGGGAGATGTLTSLVNPSGTSHVPVAFTGNAASNIVVYESLLAAFAVAVGAVAVYL